LPYKNEGTRKKGRPAKTEQQLLAERENIGNIDGAELQSIVKWLYRPVITRVVNCTVNGFPPLPFHNNLTDEEISQVKQKLEQSLGDIFEKSTMSIPRLKLYARLFVDAVFEDYEILLKMAFVEGIEQTLVWFDEEEKNIIANTIVYIYLEEWLRSCSALRQTIPSFSLYPYCFKSEIKTAKDRPYEDSLGLIAESAIWGLETNADIPKKLRDAYIIKYTKQHKNRFDQAKEEQDYKSNLPAQIKNPGKTHKKRGTTLNIQTLTLLDLISQKSYSILDLVGFYDYGVPSKNFGAKTLIKSAVDYRNYLQYVRGLYEKKDTFESSELIIRKYVSQCFVIGKIERSAGIQLRLSLANYLYQHSPEGHKFSFELAGELWGRSRYNCFRVALPIHYSTDPNLAQRTVYSYQESSFETYNYKKWFRYQHESRNSPTAGLISLRQMFKSAIIGDAFTILTSMRDPGSQRDWEQSDFYDAAAFLHDSYPFIANYLKELQGIEEISCAPAQEQKKFFAFFVATDPGRMMK